MLSKRSLGSLAQFLELYDTSFVLVLFSKHGLRLTVEGGALLLGVNSALLNQHESAGVAAVLEEVIRTRGDLRNRVAPRYRFDERYEDLTRCLLLDGYKVEGKTLVPLDPSIAEAPPIEDDLVLALAATDLDSECTILQKLNDSAEAFRKTRPNYNACMNDVRVALETLARQVAERYPKEGQSPYDPAKWGSILNFLRSVEFLTLEEEQGLAGVYRFLSPGSHRPLGLSEAEMARLGRALALSMCWFVVKHYSGTRAGA